MQLLDFFQLYILFDFFKSCTSRNVAAEASKAGGRTWGSACTIWFRVWAPETLEELQGLRWACPLSTSVWKKNLGALSLTGNFFFHNVHPGIWARHLFHSFPTGWWCWVGGRPACHCAFFWGQTTLLAEILSEHMLTWGWTSAWT